MFTALFLTFVFLHIALGLALAFLVFYYAMQTPHLKLKNFGYAVAYLLVILAILAMILGSVFVAKKPHFMPCGPRMHERMKHEEMMEQKEEMEEHGQKNVKNKISQAYNQKAGGCPVKSGGQMTGAACPHK